jgi:hypothetical protein
MVCALCLLARYRSLSVVKRPKGKGLLISGLSSNALSLYDSSSTVAVPAASPPQSHLASSDSEPSPSPTSSPWADAVVKLNIGTARMIAFFVTCPVG